MTLGYSSWNAMREHEYGGAAFMVPSKNRPEIVERIKAIEIGRTARGNAKHLTNKEIAATVGVTERQVKRDLAPDKSGQMSPFVESREDIIDAEIANTAGVSERQVRRDVSSTGHSSGSESPIINDLRRANRNIPNEPVTITNSRGHCVAWPSSAAGNLPTSRRRARVVAQLCAFLDP
ncbi:hypothetical protein [Neomicrococcus lactis]|uniref:hypothetical protein n=1 Tax=Neomicrococcus lactis TaxID=732241 RepID=UPI002300DB58|nr:hypothetical protein [Neomicrococcus lactis]